MISILLLIGIPLIGIILAIKVGSKLFKLGIIAVVAFALFYIVTSML